PSTVLMTGIPARVAGVGGLVFCAPPAQDGTINTVTLAAAALIGGCRVFKVGGAQAVAAMAYGTKTVPRCAMIAGPGNVYVAAAKRLVSETVKVDLEAGPSEVVVFHDGSFGIETAALDMLAQIEHDPLALAVLVTESPQVTRAVTDLLTESSGDVTGQVDVVLAADRVLSIAIMNELAPEHLELMAEDAARMLPGITAAGCVFLGRHTAVALGDYIAGPSHVLPTGGAAARLSGLRAEDFTHVMNVISYTREALDCDADDAATLAGMEGLTRHARSIEARRE
ncbi:MAG: histidinol dehydrogenase, partial [Candidatus Geothermincolia bacterium]